jgi:hypothetical protein
MGSEENIQKFSHKTLKERDFWKVIYIDLRIILKRSLKCRMHKCVMDSSYIETGGKSL